MPTKSMKPESLAALKRLAAKQDKKSTKPTRAPKRTTKLDIVGDLTTGYRVASVKRARRMLIVDVTPEQALEASDPNHTKRQRAEAEARWAEHDRVNGVAGAGPRVPKAETKHGEFKPNSVLLTIYEQLTKGATKEQILAALVKQFPERSAEGMATTVGIQVSRMPKERGFTVTKSDKGVYRIAK